MIPLAAQRRAEARLKRRRRQNKASYDKKKLSVVGLLECALCPHGCLAAH